MKLCIEPAAANSPLRTPAVRHRHPARFRSWASRQGRAARICASGIGGSKGPAFKGLWDFFGPRFPSPVEDPLLQAADGIRAAIGSGSIDTARIAGLVDTLQTAIVPFDERRIGNGPWQVVYTRGPLLWKGWVGPGKLANFNNKASQTFNPRSRTVVNYAELFGEGCFVRADGTYEPQGSTQATPVEVSTEIFGATLHAFGKDWKLPIKGKGKFYVMYADDSLRLIQNGPKPTASLAVQIRAKVLKRLLAEQLKAERGPPPPAEP